MNHKMIDLMSKLKEKNIDLSALGQSSFTDKDIDLETLIMSIQQLSDDDSDDILDILFLMQNVINDHV